MLRAGSCAHLQSEGAGFTPPRWLTTSTVFGGHRRYLVRSHQARNEPGRAGTKRCATWDGPAPSAEDEVQIERRRPVLLADHQETDAFCGSDRERRRVVD